MTYVQIPAVIRPAISTELFGERDTPYINAVFFSKKNNETLYYGPYHVLEDVNQSAFIARYIFRELYVIVTEGDGFRFLMNLRPAERYDLASGNNMRINQLYYIKESEEVIDGPRLLTLETDPHYLADLLNKKAIYVVAEKQEFTPFSLEKSA